MRSGVSIQSARTLVRPQPASVRRAQGTYSDMVAQATTWAHVAPVKWSRVRGTHVPVTYDVRHADF